MTTLIVYDSAYGNTGRLAEAVATALPGSIVRRIGEVNPANLPPAKIIIAGSPTQGGRPTKGMQAWLAAIPRGGLNGVAVAAFDTRIAAKEQGFALRLIMGVIGYAAPRVLEAMQGRGGLAVTSPEGFIVDGREGPLHAGELDRAAAWARSLAVQEVRAA